MFKQKKDPLPPNTSLKDFYIVEKILDKKIVDGVFRYKIKWLNYPMTDCTWEPKENLNNVGLMLKYFDENFDSESKKQTFEDSDDSNSDDEQELIVQKPKKLELSKKKDEAPIPKEKNIELQVKKFKREEPVLRKDIKNSKEKDLPLLKVNPNTKKIASHKKKKLVLRYLNRIWRTIAELQRKYPFSSSENESSSEELDKSLSESNGDASEEKFPLQKPKKRGRWSNEKKNLYLNPKINGRNIKNSHKESSIKNFSSITNFSQAKDPQINQINHITDPQINDLQLKDPQTKDQTKDPPTNQTKDTHFKDNEIIDPSVNLKGDFSLGDKGKQILSAIPAGEELACVVEWMAREDGVIPKKSKISNNIIRKYDPELLVRFYESKLRFDLKKQEKEKNSEEEEQKKPEKNSEEGVKKVNLEDLMAEIEEKAKNDI